MLGLHSLSIIHVWSLSDTLHSSRVESIGTSIIHVWSLQYSSRVESIVTLSAVGFWQWSSSRHYKLIRTLLHCLYLFILMSSMFNNYNDRQYKQCLWILPMNTGYGQFHTFIPSVLLIFYISGANTSFTGNTILHRRNFTQHR